MNSFSIGCASRPKAVASPPRSAVAAEAAQQVLYRAELRRGGERLTMRWALRAWRADRFELRASDPLGRGLWTISVAGADGVFVDLRSGAGCRFAAAGVLSVGEIPLDVPVVTLPRVLAGRLPVPIPPASRSIDSEGRSTFSFAGADGASWSGTLVRDSVLSWRLSRAGRVLVEVSIEAPEVRARTDSGLELEWHSVARETLTAPDPPIVVPSEVCRDADLP